MGIWSDMNHDLLVLMAKSISSPKDFVMFGSVCRTWRSAATRDNFTYSLPKAPWLMLSEKQVDDDEREFYSLPEDKIYKIALPPEVSGKRCFSSSQGWIFTVGTRREVHLVHPLSRTVIQLPDLSTFPMWDDEYPNWGVAGFDVAHVQRCFIEKVALSPNFNNNPLTSSSSSKSKSKYVVMVICGEGMSLCFHREGDEGWTLVDIPGSTFFDVVYHNGQFYGVDTVGRVFACDVDAPASTAKYICTMPHYTSIIEKLYLVKVESSSSSSSGKLLVISREGVAFREDAEDGYGTTCFHVFQHNGNSSSGGGEWEEVKSIGDAAIFLGNNTSLCIDVYQEGVFKTVGCKANCIYFADDCLESYYSLPNGGGKDMGVYNLQDGSIEPHYKGQSRCRLNPPLWVALGL